MYIIEVSSGIKRPVIISEVEPEDFQLLTKKRFSFDWKVVKNTCAVYKLQIDTEKGILGVIGLIDIPPEKRVEIKLLSCSAENKGKRKVYERIAGCLISYACSFALNKYDIEACVSLVPKTKLVKHYIRKYNMKHGGWQLYLDRKELIQLIKEYS